MIVSIDQSMVTAEGRVAEEDQNVKKDEMKTHIPPRDLCDSFSPDTSNYTSQHDFLLGTAIFHKHGYGR